MYKKRRHVWNDKNGISSIIETIIATAIIFAVLALFYSSVTSLYHVHVRTDVDLQVKCDNICDIFISSPGKDNTSNINWEDKEEIKDVRSLGLAATPTIAWGEFTTISGGVINEISPPTYNLFHDDAVGGIISSCFLAGTEIITADGSYKNIEDVKVGDIVKSFNIKTGNIDDSRVINVFCHPPEEMTDYYLVINNFLKVTPNHLLYNEGQWIFFDQVNVGDIVNNIFIYSVEKVSEQMPTYDLNIKENHNYFIHFSDDSFLVHNEDIIDWNPWVPTSKDPYPTVEPADYEDYYFKPFGRGYYVEYTPDVPNGGTGIYEIKGETNYRLPILDSQKINKLRTYGYPEVKSILGLVDNYGFYNFNITITTSGESWEYGATYEYADIIVSSTQDVLIYHPPIFDTVVILPHYESGQITVRMFF